MHILAILLTAAALAVVAFFVHGIVRGATTTGYRILDFASEVGAVTLAEAAVLSTDDLQRGVIETFVEFGRVLDRIPLLGIQGNAYAYNEEGTLPGVAFRAVNEAYVESTGTVNQKTESLVILGGDADVDRFIQQTRSNLNDQRATQTRMKVKAATIKYEDTFFNGDVVVDPKGFDGLRKRLVGNQVLDVTGANGQGPVEGGHDFFDSLDALIARARLNAGQGALYANAGIISRIMSSARRLGGADFLNEELTRKRVPTYNGIPLLDPGEKANGDPILAMNETMGTSTDTGSIYAVRYGEDEGDQAVTGLTNGGVMVDDLGQLQEKPAYRTRIEFYCGVAVFGGRAAARLRGVRNA